MCWINRNGLYKGVRSLTGALLLPFLFAGCEGYLDVENPASLLDEDLGRPELLGSLANTPEGNLAEEYTNLMVRSGLLSDELFHPTTQLENIDAMRGNRLASNSAVEDHWRGIAQARWLSDEVIERVSELISDPASHMAVARARFIGGLARITMADHFNVIVYGPEDQLRGPIDVIEDAIEEFNQAAQVAAAAGDANYEAAALGQIARAYRSLYFEELHLRGNESPDLFDQAEAAARQALAVRPDYNVSLQYGAPGSSNDMASLGGPLGGTNRVDEAFLFLPDPVTGAWDPRVPHEEQLRPEPNGQTAWNLKFTGREDPMPVSRAAEAMLIIAEARLMDGDLAGAVEWINRTRAAARQRVSSEGWADASRGWPPSEHELSALPDFDSHDADEIHAQLLHERRTEFWLEMRYWQDMRYYEIMPYRWLQPNKDAGVHLRWPPAPEEIANNENLTAADVQQVYVGSGS